MARLLYGNYGHHGRGKQYVYWGGDNYRTGQNVVAPVTDPVTGKTYRTMFTIRRTSAGEMGEKEAERLEARGIAVKDIDGRNVMSLPGAKDFSSAAQWKRESDERYNRLLSDRMSSGGGNKYRYKEGWQDTRRTNIRSVFLRRFQ